MADLYDVTASEAARRIRSRALSPSNLLAACLKRIDATEPTLKAWVHLDRDAAARVAVQRDIEAREGRFMGPLHGVPVALKDIYDAAGLVTTSGAGPWAHRHPTADAVSVARLRAAGAVILGKVTTTPFALRDPTATGNPWNAGSHPGRLVERLRFRRGRARMVPLALGTQTVGSVLRPAAYCGVVGFKPTHGRISTVGVTPLAWSLDHVGVLCRSVEDAALGALGHGRSRPRRSSLRGHAVRGLRWRAGRAGGAAYRRAAAVARPRRAGQRGADRRDSSRRSARVGRMSRTLRSRPRSTGFTRPEIPSRVPRRPPFIASSTRRHAAEYPKHIGEAVKAGLGIAAVDYIAAQGRRRAFRAEMAAIARALRCARLADGRRPRAEGARVHG